MAKKMQRTELQNELLQALSAALTHSTVSLPTGVVIDEARHQAVLSLICSDVEALSIIANNVQLMWEQEKLCEVLYEIPFLVLKGSCTAIYYPEPLRRMLGDIDLLVAPDSFLNAYHALEAAGYQTSDPIDGSARHVHFSRGGASIELHRRFAILQTKEQEALLDNWLYNAKKVTGKIGKYTFPMPNEQLNGLVLLAHINQHLEEGLGLRQLLDFVMFIKRSLSDDAWPAFKDKTDQLGLTTLAKVVGKLGQMYLGLDSTIAWCADAKESTVEKLLDYAFECGNFGHKDSANNTITMVMSHGRGLKGFFCNLQRQGENNWDKLKTQPWLRPVAWIYQLGRYIKRGLRVSNLREIYSDIAASKRRNQLLDELEATRMAYRD